VVIGFALLAVAAAVVIHTGLRWWDIAWSLAGAVGGWLMIVGFAWRRLLRDRRLPGYTSLLSLGLAILAWLLGWPTLFAFAGGVLLGNAWTIHLARARGRPAP